LTFLMAVLSYYFIERPMIRLGHQLAQKRLSSHVTEKEPQTPNALV